MVPQQVSFVERSSLSQRVPYQRFHCNWGIRVSFYLLVCIFHLDLLFYFLQEREARRWPVSCWSFMDSRTCWGDCGSGWQGPRPPWHRPRPPPSATTWRLWKLNWHNMRSPLFLVTKFSLSHLSVNYISALFCQ